MAESLRRNSHPVAVRRGASTVLVTSLLCVPVVALWSRSGAADAKRRSLNGVRVAEGFPPPPQIYTLPTPTPTPPPSLIDIGKSGVVTVDPQGNVVITYTAPAVSLTITQPIDLSTGSYSATVTDPNSQLNLNVTAGLDHPANPTFIITGPLAGTGHFSTTFPPGSDPIYHIDHPLFAGITGSVDWGKLSGGLNWKLQLGYSGSF